MLSPETSTRHRSEARPGLRANPQPSPAAGGGLQEQQAALERPLEGPHTAGPKTRRLTVRGMGLTPGSSHRPQTDVQLHSHGLRSAGMQPSRLASGPSTRATARLSDCNDTADAPQHEQNVVEEEAPLSPEPGTKSWVVSGRSTRNSARLSALAEQPVDARGLVTEQYSHAAMMACPDGPPDHDDDVLRGAGPSVADLLFPAATRRARSRPVGQQLPRQLPDAPLASEPLPKVSPGPADCMRADGPERLDGPSSLDPCDIASCQHISGKDAPAETSAQDDAQEGRASAESVHAACDDGEAGQPAALNSMADAEQRIAGHNKRHRGKHRPVKGLHSSTQAAPSGKGKAPQHPGPNCPTHASHYAAEQSHPPPQDHHESQQSHAQTCANAPRCVPEEAEGQAGSNRPPPEHNSAPLHLSQNKEPQIAAGASDPAQLQPKSLKVKLKLPNKEVKPAAVATESAAAAASAAGTSAPEAACNDASADGHRVPCSADPQDKPAAEKQAHAEACQDAKEPTAAPAHDRKGKRKRNTRSLVDIGSTQEDSHEALMAAGAHSDGRRNAGHQENHETFDCGRDAQAEDGMLCEVKAAPVSDRQVRRSRRNSREDGQAHHGGQEAMITTQIRHDECQEQHQGRKQSTCSRAHENPEPNDTPERAQISLDPSPEGYTTLRRHTRSVAGNSPSLSASPNKDIKRRRVQQEAAASPPRRLTRAANKSH